MPNRIGHHTDDDDDDDESFLHPRFLLSSLHDFSYSLPHTVIIFV